MRRNRFMTSQPTQSVTLTPEQSKFVDECIVSGRFKSVDEMFSEGLRLLEAEEAEYQTALEKARGLIKECMDAADRGETVDAKEALGRIKERHNRLQSESLKA
jgi:antitoxin ParD1/3/4